MSFNINYAHFNDISLTNEFSLNKIHCFCQEKKINLYTYNLIIRLFYHQANFICDVEFSPDEIKNIFDAYSKAEFIGAIDVLVITFVFHIKNMQGSIPNLLKVILNNPNTYKITGILKIFDVVKRVFSKKNDLMSNFTHAKFGSRVMNQFIDCHTRVDEEFKTSTEIHIKRIYKNNSLDEYTWLKGHCNSKGLNQVRVFTFLNPIELRAPTITLYAYLLSLKKYLEQSDIGKFAENDTYMLIYILWRYYKNIHQKYLIVSLIPFGALFSQAFFINWSHKTNIFLSTVIMISLIPLI